MVSLFFAYVLLLFGGPTGVHLAYVGRQRQAHLWSVSAGFFFIGLVRDFYCMPRYVREANSDEREIARLKRRMDDSPDAPANYWSRLICQYILAWYFATVLSGCDQQFMWALSKIRPEMYQVLTMTQERAIFAQSVTGAILASIGAMIGCIGAGNVGPERVSARQAFNGAMIWVWCWFFLEQLGDFIGAIIDGEASAARIFDELTPLYDADKGMGNGQLMQASFGAVYFCTRASAKAWAPAALEESKAVGKRSHGRFSFCIAIVKIWLIALTFLPFASFASYNYGDFVQTDAVTDARHRVRLKHVVDGFLDEHKDDFAELQRSLGQAYAYIEAHGFQKVWEEIRSRGPKYAADNAYKTLGLPKDADEDLVKKAFRKLSVKYHPDKMMHATEEEKKEAAEKYERIVEAHDVLKQQFKRRKKAKD